MTIEITLFVVRVCLVQAEALLRTVFRQLDPSDSGSAPLDVLMACLDDTSNNSDEDHDNEQHGVAAEQSDDVTLGSIISKELGLLQWNTLVASLREALANASSKDPTLTWGEFLLCLIPSDLSSHVTAPPCQLERKESRGQYSRLSSREMSDLRDAKLMGDLEWGLVC
jgi:hypothetical protein